MKSSIVRVEWPMVQIRMIQLKDVSAFRESSACCSGGLRPPNRAVAITSRRAIGERVRLARWQWRPRHRELLQMRAPLRCYLYGISARRRKCAGESARAPRTCCSARVVAHSRRERVSIRRRIRLVAITGADCKIESPAIHRETSARFVRRTDATIYDRHRLVLGHACLRDLDIQFYKPYSRVVDLSERQTVGEMVRGRRNEYRPQPAR